MTHTNNPTDTNQASEDELQKKIKGLNVYKAAVNMHVSYRSDQANLPRFAGSWEKEIESLIRTEKLKLLAEVRERVVGEDVECDGTCNDGACGAKQRLIDFQRQQLAKLEAEL
jgi:hypothetical protein